MHCAVGKHHVALDTIPRPIAYLLRCVVYRHGGLASLFHPRKSTHPCIILVTPVHRLITALQLSPSPIHGQTVDRTLLSCTERIPAIPEAVLMVEIQERFLSVETHCPHASLAHFVAAFHTRNLRSHVAANDATGWLFRLRVFGVPQCLFFFCFCSHGSTGIGGCEFAGAS